MRDLILLLLSFLQVVILISISILAHPIVSADKENERKNLHIGCNPMTLMERQQLRRRSHTGPKWPQIPKISVFWPPSLSVCVCLCYKFWSLKWGQGKWEGNSSLTNCKSRFIILCGSSAHKHHDSGCCPDVAKLRLENFDSFKPLQPL